MLFPQEVIDNVKTEGRARIVVDEGLLFSANETAFVQTKRELLDERDQRGTTLREVLYGMSD